MVFTLGSMSTTTFSNTVKNVPNVFSPRSPLSVSEPGTSATGDLSSKLLTQLLTLLEPVAVSQARPAILHSVSAPSLRQFVSAFRNYSMVGGTRPAVSFLHSDVTLYFQTPLGLDFSSDDYLDSDVLLSVFRNTYAPKRSEYLSLLTDLKLQSSALESFDKGAVNDYTMRFCADSPQYRQS